MAISVDWSLTPFRLTIPQSDLTLDTGTKYNLTVDTFWTLIRDFADDIGTMAQPVPYTRIPATASTPSITEVNINYYDLQFEDGLYSVNIINGNTNIRDVEIKNMVSVNTNNTTGFIDPIFLEQGLFEGHVSIDVVNGVTGVGKTPQGEVIGTRQTPSNNLTDAKVIAGIRGLNTLQILNNMTFIATDVLDDLTVLGENPSQSMLTFVAGCSTKRSFFAEAELVGTLNGALEIRRSHFEGLSGIGGNSSETNIIDCIFETGSIVLSTVSAQHLHIINCHSGPPDNNNKPIIDFNGIGANLTLSNYNGQLQFNNATNGQFIRCEMGSGEITIDASCTNCTVLIRGNTTVINNGGVGVTLVNESSSELTWLASKALTVSKFLGLK